MSAVLELLLSLALLALQASPCRGACVEVDSNTEAVANEAFTLGCISCKMRGEVPATAYVEWFFKASDADNFTNLYSYVKGKPAISDPRFFDRLKWNGSNHTEDLQDGSIVILNVTFNDTGTYKCIFKRTLNHQGAGLHLVRGDDVRLHRRAAGVARDRDGLLLQEDIGGGGGGPERERGGVLSRSAGKQGPRCRSTSGRIEPVEEELKMDGSGIVRFPLFSRCGEIKRSRTKARRKLLFSLSYFLLKCGEA
uniref:Sodium channel regulatory subunit beta-1 n=1 Tax=Gasterosteus aculeatus aculeatus TaxID=481459 RepID=A0AAQ4R3N6_GASAC